MTKTKGKTPRELALLVLHAVEQDGAYANLELNKVLEKYQPSKLDRGFITELVYGTLRSLHHLDWVLGGFLSRPLNSLTPWIRNILRLGVYQIFYLDKVPPSAAVNEAVNLAKNYGHGGTVKFVNGVLRNLLRNKDNIEYPDLKKNPALHISVVYSHPLWMVEKWLAQLGQEATINLCRANNEAPPTTIRTNTLRIERDALVTKLSGEDLEVKETSFVPEGLRVEGFVSLGSLPAFKEGLFQVQDESSMLVGHICRPREGFFVIDACSAPGGKTTHLAQLMNNRGTIVALDIHPHKLGLIQDNCHRLGITCVQPHNLDARQLPGEWKEQADLVLVDAPCSGLGVLRRRPDARWRKEAQDLPAIQKLQLEILDGAAQCVKPGGTLVYSTCTITPEENTEVITKFLAAHPEFAPEDLSPYLPKPLQQLNLPTAREGFIQLLPHLHGMDGFFIARLNRRG
ncbi:MAG: 16S rRNA (cytosine(967)-C(5))-methyltransferase RsmB [Clostridia bacterium]|nr:16S rRNA (cytosine(967)-C(5))-methyltransferase RsmB [Clostridia bacterium]